VAGHQRVHDPKQDCRGHSSENGTRVAARHIAKTARHAAIKPTLDRDDIFH